jgi:hypothetical protein
MYVMSIWLVNHGVLAAVGSAAGSVVVPWLEYLHQRPEAIAVVVWFVVVVVVVVAAVVVVVVAVVVVVVVVAVAAAAAAVVLLGIHCTFDCKLFQHEVENAMVASVVFVAPTRAVVASILYKIGIPVFKTCVSLMKKIQMEWTVGMMNMD